MSGEPTLVTHWAQLQSVVELVSAVALAGVLQGLTVLIAQVRESRDEQSLLNAALKLGLGTSLAVALAVLLVAGNIRGEIKPDLFMLAALAGCIAVIPATLNAYWLGKQQQRMLGLFAEVMTLERAALWYLVSYLVYLAFTAASLIYSSRKPIIVQSEIDWKQRCIEF